MSEGRGGISLYEYWGITDNAAVVAAGGGLLGSLAAAAAATCDDEDDDEDTEGLVESGRGGNDADQRAAAADRAVEAWFIKAVSRLGDGRCIGGEGDLDERQKRLSRMADRSIWIVFRSCPLIPCFSSAERPV